MHAYGRKGKKNKQLEWEGMVARDGWGGWEGNGNWYGLPQEAGGVASHAHFINVEILGRNHSKTIKTTRINYHGIKNRNKRNKSH